jgi:XTP/dITP diphosphohydrolase
MDVTFVTSDPDKVAEVRRVFSEFGIGVRWSRQELTEPQSDRLEPVVRAKLAVAARPGRSVVVEDSGLFIEALGGFPGVYSRYVYDTVGLAGVLRLLKGRPRRATFRAVAGYRRARTTILTVGEVDGTIAPRETGSNGFGYDPIFVPLGSERTFAEMTGAEKDRHSHRGRAMRALARKVGTQQRK